MMILPNGSGGFNIFPTPISTIQSSKRKEYCPKCHKEEDIKTVCRHCDHEYIEEDSETGIGFTIFLLLAFLFISFFILYIVDYTVLNSKYNNKFFHSYDCEYSVPDGYKIVYNDENKKYAVSVLSYSNKYLYESSGGTSETFADISEPSKFDDSCQAKGYLKDYIDKKL